MIHHHFQRQVQKNKFLLFTAASVLAHLGLICLLLVTAAPDSKIRQSEVVEISFADIEPQKTKIPNPTTIVESDSSEANMQLSENAKFLSEKNNTVKKETKAKSGEKFHNSKKSAVAGQKQPVQKEIQQQAKTRKSKSQDAKADIFDNSFDAFSSMNKKAEKKQQAQVGSSSDLGSTTNDNLEKIESDLMTRLNTKEYRYFGYYSRIKSQLNQWWVPKVQQKFTKMLRQGRTIASEDNKITKLVIILDNSGHLVKVQVLGESGIKDLDDAAIEAFRQAAPFPNPPKGMVDKDGLVKIRWDCVVES